MSERLTRQLAMTDYYYRLVYQKAVVRYAKECGCVSPSIRQLPPEEQIKLYQSGQCLTAFVRFGCMLRRRAGIVSQSLKLIPALLAQGQIVHWNPLCPYREYKHRQQGCQSQQRRTQIIYTHRPMAAG